MLNWTLKLYLVTILRRVSLASKNCCKDKNYDGNAGDWQKLWLSLQNRTLLMRMSEICYGVHFNQTKPVISGLTVINKWGIPFSYTCNEDVNWKHGDSHFITHWSFTVCTHLSMPKRFFLFSWLEHRHYGVKQEQQKCCTIAGPHDRKADKISSVNDICGTTELPQKWKKSGEILELCSKGSPGQD